MVSKGGFLSGGDIRVVRFNPTLLISKQHLLLNSHVPFTLPPYLDIKTITYGFIEMQAGIPRAPSFSVVGCSVFDTERVMLLENLSAWQNNLVLW